MLREELQNSLKEAMKNKDMATVGAIRLIIAGQKEKDVEARGKGLEKASDADLLSMMQTMIKQRNESIKVYNFVIFDSRFVNLIRRYGLFFCRFAISTLQKYIFILK